MLLHYDEYDSPIGRILFASDEGQDGMAVCALDFAGYEARMQQLLARRYAEIEYRRGSDPLGVAERLAAYFGGQLHALEALPVNSGGTPFQATVWNALRTIPAGQTWSYGQLAAKLARPTAARAVGHANSLNPVALIVPCHRVVGAGAALTGYAGGLQRKQWLLDHERTAAAA